MEKGLLFNYWILSPDHEGALPVTKYSALRSEENGAEAILGYRMLYFEVDGIEYTSQQTGAMIGIRPTNLLAASNGETTTHDSFRMRHMCRDCNKPFELDEYRWIKNAGIRCVCQKTLK